MIAQEIKPEQKAFDKEGYKGEKNPEISGFIVKINRKFISFWRLVCHTFLTQ